MLYCLSVQRKRTDCVHGNHPVDFLFNKEAFLRFLVENSRGIEQAIHAVDWFDDSLLQNQAFVQSKGLIVHNSS